MPPTVQIPDAQLVRSAPHPQHPHRPLLIIIYARERVPQLFPLGVLRLCGRETVAETLSRCTSKTTEREEWAPLPAAPPTGRGSSGPALWSLQGAAALRAGLSPLGGLFRSCEKGGDCAGGQRPGPGQARACVSPGGGSPGHSRDTAARLPGSALYAPSPGRCVAASRPVAYCMSKFYLRISI